LWASGKHETHLKHLSVLLQERLTANPLLAMAYVTVIRDREAIQRLMNGLRKGGGGTTR
jgi:hypothetical protein